MRVAAEWLTAAPLMASGIVVVAGAIGLARLGDFFLRMHAPALASTLGVWLVTFASIVYFSARANAPTLHVWLVIVALAITAPITTIVLARAALFRRRNVGDALPRPLGRDAGPT